MSVHSPSPALAVAESQESSFPPALQIDVPSDRSTEMAEEEKRGEETPSANSGGQSLNGSVWEAHVSAA